MQEPTARTKAILDGRVRLTFGAWRLELHALIFAFGLVLLGLGAVGWVLTGGPASFGQLIVVVDLTIGGVVLTTGSLVGRARAAEARRDLQVRVLGQAARRMSAGRTPDEVAMTLVEEVRQVIASDHTAVFLVDAGDELAPVIVEGATGPYAARDRDHLRARIGVGVAGYAASHGPLRVDDAARDSRGLTLAATDPHRSESLMAAPMWRDDVLVGVITLSRLARRGFTDDDLRLLGILADQAATAFAGAASLAEAQRLALEQRRLLDMSSALAGSLNPKDVAGLIAGHLAGATAADVVVVSDLDMTGGHLRALAASPEAAATTQAAMTGPDGSPAVRRALRDRAVVIVDAEDPAADPAEVARLHASGLAGVVILPLVAKGEPIGVVQLGTLARPTADPGWLTLARTMAHEAGMALENARIYEQARNLADHDPLTGFFNHRYLHERLAEEVVRASRTRQPLAVVMMDLDGFKLVNDSFGHIYGDRVLAFAATLIRTTLRTSDVAARYGGDEFALILPETSATAAAKVADRLQVAFRDGPFRSDDRSPYQLGASIGIASYPAEGRTPAELLAAADANLYQAKRSGGSLVRSGTRAGDGEPMATEAPGVAAPDVAAAAPAGPLAEARARRGS